VNLTGLVGKQVSLEDVFMETLGAAEDAKR
jgi:hypothetical protein